MKALPKAHQQPAQATKQAHAANSTTDRYTRPQIAQQFLLSHMAG